MLTDFEKSRIISQWLTRMPLAHIRQMTDIEPREFDLAVREMKRNGEFPKSRKNTEAKIVEAYHKGERNAYELAKRFGVKPNTVYKILCVNKLSLGTKSRNFVHCDRTNAIIEDLQDGILSQVEIAKKHNVTKQYINKLKGKLKKWEEQDSEHR